MANWRMWAHGVKALAEMAVATALAKISGVSNPKPSWVRQYNHMKNLDKSLGILSCARPADWVVEEIEKGFQFDPIRPAKYSEGALLLHMPRVVVASATCRKKSMYLIGLGNDTFDFHEYLSDFNPEDCPIYYIPTMRVDVYAKSLSELWIKFDQIAARRRDRNGLVQSVSYKRSQELYEASRFRDSFVMNKKGEPIDSTISKFLNGYPGAILVSPSFEEGYNFPGTALEWIFCMKIPFDPPSAIAKARSEADPNYGGYQAMQRLVQLFGRGARYRGDRCEGFICDKHMDWFEPRFRGQAPKWFRQFFKREYYVPQPPPRLT
jgi:Rad3-related DNA helicase